MYTNTTHSTATIEWRVSTINYTPERYNVEYGISSTILNGRSDFVQSGSDITIMNNVYSTTITELSSNTTYYYRVVATNSFSSTATSQNTFVTVAIRELLFHI